MPLPVWNHLWLDFPICRLNPQENAYVFHLETITRPVLGTSSPFVATKRDRC